MYNKYGGKVRLTFKLQLDQLWIGTKGLLHIYLIAGSYFQFSAIRHSIHSADTQRNKQRAR